MKSSLVAIVAVFFLAAPHAVATSDVSPRASCARWIAGVFSGAARRVWPERSKPLTFDEFAALGRVPTSQFFPEPETPRNDSFEGALVPEAARAKFYEELDRYLDAYALHMGAFRDGFRTWWKLQRDTLVNGRETDLWRASGKTLADVAAAAQVEFARTRPDVPTTTLGQAFRTLGRRVFFDAPRYLGRKAFALVVLGTVLGTWPKLYNAFTGSIVNPLEQTAGQAGAVVWAPVAEWEQSVLSDPRKLAMLRANVDDAKAELGLLDDLAKDVERLDAEQLRAREKAMQRGFFRFYQKYNQGLPAHLRDGRGVSRDLVINQLMLTSTALATFQNQSRSWDAELRTLPPGSEAYRQAKAERDAAEDRMATTLAMSKLLEIQYPEFTDTAVGADAAAPLAGMYDVFSRGMRLDRYRAKYATEVREVLRRLRVQVGRAETELAAMDEKWTKTRRIR